MHSYRIDPVAQLELEEAGNAYIRYFAGLGEIERGEELADAFFDAYIDKIHQLEQMPFMHPLCNVYPFDGGSPLGYRSFRLGWFTVFYTVETATLTVWHVRSSKSDFTTIQDALTVPLTSTGNWAFDRAALYLSLWLYTQTSSSWREWTPSLE